MQYMFVGTIGPVQDFIATARTSQDLWFGSWMLSELAKAMAKSLAEGGAELIFPNPKNIAELDNPELNASNKVVVQTDGDPGKLAEKAKLKVQDRLAQLSLQGLKHVPSQYRDTARQQLGNLLEFYWASSEILSDDYASARRSVEAALAARKNTRSFNPWSGSSEEKSSMDGFREGVLQGPKDRDMQLLAQGEVLSGVDVVKRFGTRKGTNFKSTSDFAAAPFREGLGTLDSVILQEIKDVLKRYTNETETDGAHYFVERLTRFLDDSKRDDFRDAYWKIFESHHVKRSPGPYYALLRADGDFMGRLIDAQETKEKHKQLSRALSGFAEVARKIITKHGGQAVYVGGDDILAYLPLHTALVCVTELDKAFSAAMQDFAYKDDTGESHYPTLSAGLVVAHHLTPLSDVMDASRRAENAAKERVPGKHALAIILQKRGSGESMVVGPMEGLLRRMKRFVDLRASGTLSHSAAYELRNLANFLQRAGLKKEAFAQEAARVLKRKNESGGAEKSGDMVIQEIENWLKQITLAELAAEMIAAAEFAKAQNLAQFTRKEASA